MQNSETHIHRRNLLQWAAGTSLAASMPSWAQATWPTKPVNLIVPFPAGGGTDAFARPLSAIFSKLTGKQLIIDNRGGAGGTVAQPSLPRLRQMAITFSWVQFITPLHPACIPN